MIILVLLLISFHVDAKNCKKGQSCGNSCISWNKICRIGTSPDYISKESKLVKTSLSNQDIQVSISKVAGFEQTDEVVFGCETSWGAIVDRFIFNDNVTYVIDKAVAKIRSRFEEREEALSVELEKEVRIQYRNLLGSSLFNEPTIKEIKTHSHKMKKDYIPSCVTQSFELSSKKILHLANKMHK